MKAYCFQCGADTIVTRLGYCSWCDEKIANETTPSRYPTGRKSYIGDEDLYRRAYEEYLEVRSLRRVCARIWQDAGYTSLKSCHNSLWEAFRARGWQMYTRSYARTTHGLARRGRVDPTHKRNMRIKRGEIHGRLCKARRTQYPDKGARCRRHATYGSDYCYQHDPANHDQIRAHLDRIREASRRDS